MGGMTILHASITEYLIFFGTTVGTEGHTVRTDHSLLRLCASDALRASFRAATLLTITLSLSTASSGPTPLASSPSVYAVTPLRSTLPYDLPRAQVFRPGDMNLMPRWEARQYRMPDQAFALEYARGWIPSMVPFGTFDVFFSTLDFVALGQLVRVYAGHIIRELLQGKF